MNIRCLIIDDKPLALDVLADYAGKIPFLEVVAVTTNPLEGLSIIKNQSVDLVFLDIQMPELTGIQFMKIAGKQCKIVLTTAYSEYALDGFEYDVIDYLLKPIAFERFYRAAEKALHAITNTSVHIKNDKTIQDENAQPDYLFVKTEHRIQKINLHDILYIEGLQNYINIYAVTGRIMSLMTMKKIEEQLPGKEFARVHKSYIVSLRHITSIERGCININAQAIPIGDSYREAFYKLIGNA